MTLIIISSTVSETDFVNVIALTDLSMHGYQQNL